MPEDFKEKILSLAAPFEGTGHSHMQRALKKLLACEVSSFEDLERVLSTGTKGQKATACWVIGRLGKKRDAKILLQVLENKKADRGVVSEAGVSLALLESKATIRPLIRVLREGATPKHRHFAAYALKAFHDDAVIYALAEVVADVEEKDSVRGQAAESLGGAAGSTDKRRKPYLQAGRILTKALDDPSAEVRFWAAFGLSCLGYRKALPALRKLARSDKRLVPWWWYVHEEAEDAIAAIEGRDYPWRTPVHLRKKTAKNAHDRARIGEP